MFLMSGYFISSGRKENVSNDLKWTSNFFSIDRTPNTDELDSTARQQAVHETVIGEVEKYVGHAVDLVRTHTIQRRL